MSKQMYQTDDENLPRKAGFWQPKADHQPVEPPRSSSDSQGRAGKSGQEEHGMGSQNRFEKWQQKQVSSRQEPILPPNSKAVKSAFGLIWQVLSTVILAGIITATLFSLWMPGNFAAGSLGKQVGEVIADGERLTQTEIAAGVLPAGFPTNRIGIVVGHRGFDSGAVCANGLTELEINSNVATYAQQKLIAAGFEVDLLDEFDARLKNYEAGLLLSIHSVSCDYINDSATGFKVAAAFSQKGDQSSTRLVQCLADRYANITGLWYHYQSVTTDMTSYHAFDEISPYTTAGIIELGFLNLDQEILKTQPELLAEGIFAGISCYMNDEEVKQP